MIPVVLVTGFLGSGKTTLLRNLAAGHPGRRWVFLVNDFGSVDVDGELMKQAGERVVAVSGGSIFCTCVVTDFIRTLREIAEGREEFGGVPDALIVEASGMADPRVIHQMLKETELDARFVIARIVALADPGTFHKLLKTLPNLRRQIESADTVLITKTDLHSLEQIEQVRADVLAIQPEALCAEAVNGRVDIDLIAARRVPLVDGHYALCADPHYHRFTLAEPLPGLEDLRRLCERTGVYLYRMKGFIREEGQTLAVDYSSSGFKASAWTGDPAVSPRIVCIAAGKAGANVERVWTNAAQEASLSP